jgi:transcriptional regulator with XRE-family HTH domain
MNHTQKQLADNIARAMPRNMKQDELAKAAGVSRVSVNNILNGKGNPKLDTLIRIAQALNISPSALLVGINDSPVTPSDVAALVSRLNQP